MTKQQSKRRRKRYQPGSAYAGDVKPTGIFSIFGNVRLFFLVGVLIMVGSLAAGGILGGTLLTGRGQGEPDTFVRPGDNEDGGTPDPDETVEVRQFQAAPPLTLDPSKRYVATIETDAGAIEIELFADQVPQTVNNFVFLASNNFYDGLIFHRVVEGFSAQAGDPGCQAGDTSDLCRGGGGPGYDLPQEQPGAFAEGTLGMANASQFFIAFDSSDQFAEFTPFGRITSGLSVAEQLTQGTEIRSITITES